MIDSKKFIVAFLILAILAGSSALLLSQNSGHNTTPSAAVLGAPLAVNEGALGSPFSGNAFNSAPQKIAFENSSGVIMAPATSSDNLTSQIVDAYVNNMNLSVPDASQGNATDTVTVDAPSEQALLSAISSSSLFANVSVPNWDQTAALKSLQVSTDTSPAAVTAYSNALSNVASRYISTTGLPGIVGDSNTATLDSASFVTAQVNDALNAITALPAPQNLADFQKSLVRVMTYDKNILALTGEASADPVKAQAIFQAEDGRYQIALAQFNAALQSAAKNPSFSFVSPVVPPARKDAAAAFVENFFGIPTAHAQYIAITFNPTQFARTIWEWAQKLLLQILKNTIIARLQSAAINLIRNSGNPLFIQAFGPFLAGAFNVAAGAALGQIVPSLCGNFSTNVTSWLKSTFSNINITSGGVSLNGSPGTNCTLQTIVGNPSRFYNNFNTYGFQGYAALLQPQNNPYGAFLEAYNSVITSAAANETAAKEKAVANQGYKGQTSCGTGGGGGGGYTCPSGTYLCTSNNGCYSQPSCAGINLGTARASSGTSGGTCSNGTEATIHTPGKTLSDMLSGRLKGDSKLTVNANALVGLLTSVLSNVIMGAINKSGLF